jgi:hypothetical protein
MMTLFTHYIEPPMRNSQCLAIAMFCLLVLAPLAQAQTDAEKRQEDLSQFRRAF